MSCCNNFFNNKVAHKQVDLVLVPLKQRVDLVQRVLLKQQLLQRQHLLQQHPQRQRLLQPALKRLKLVLLDKLVKPRQMLLNCLSNFSKLLAANRAHLAL